MENKDAFYFSHDSNARFDTKMLKLRAKYGLEGYGFYFCILEIMRDNSDYKLQVNDIDVVAFQLQIESEKTNELLEFCIQVGLFIRENGYIYSPSFLERMEQMNEKRKKRQEAGRKGGLSSKSQANLKQNVSNAQAMLKQNESMKGKEKKEKEIKENNIKKITDPYYNPIKTKFMNDYEKIFNKKAYLSNMNCLKLVELSQIVDDMEQQIPIVLEKLKNIEWKNIDFKPDVSWLLKDDNFISVLNGEHDNKVIDDEEKLKQWFRGELHERTN